MKVLMDMINALNHPPMLVTDPRVHYARYLQVLFWFFFFPTSMYFLPVHLPCYPHVFFRPSLSPIQRAIHDVEFHLRQALSCASKARQSGEGEAAEALSKSAAERLSLLLCQEGRDGEAAEVLKRHGFT